LKAVGGSVLIVDDHAAFRAAAGAMLRTAGFDVVGEAADGAAAVAAALRLQPDILLLDVRLPDCDGFAVAERVSAGHGAPLIVLTSNRSVTSFHRRLRSNPSWKFIPKSELSGEALRALAGGD
jgi:DNA-binding NarL/FixJ family response regulator